ncbi:hypothetical protein [Magnetospira sp. QH-2]|uniref:hypothetical protein n=1 Tax=Magnetospira sp. (strain QH-2) TaxID=1288970 RepID=UPI0003E80BA2|nr:hypothetical protein [Magnetospira sp. QH-2]CCQ74194.1 Protein of unknown function [Magnetospira sp. QH-2]
MKMFLDIDGVLLTRQGGLSVGAEIFLRHIVDKHEAYWLSTRTNNGTLDGARKAFHGLLHINLIERIQPVRWTTLKTEALPFGTENWLWIDDELMFVERQQLEAENALGNFLRINLRKQPDILNTLRF